MSTYLMNIYVEMCAMRKMIYRIYMYILFEELRIFRICMCWNALKLEHLFDDVVAVDDDELYNGGALGVFFCIPLYFTHTFLVCYEYPLVPSPPLYTRTEILDFGENKTVYICIKRT